jgi:hypothetical protein
MHMRRSLLLNWIMACICLIGDLPSAAGPHLPLWFTPLTLRGGGIGIISDGSARYK